MIVFENDPLLTTVNNDPLTLLTIANDLLQKTIVFFVLLQVQNEWFVFKKKVLKIQEIA